MKKFSLVISLVATGGAALGLEIISYSEFSFMYGYVIKHVGFFLSVFMIGASAGALLAGHNGKKSTIFKTYLCELFFIILAMIAYFAPRIFLPIPTKFYPLIFYIINFLPGFFTGYQFVLLCFLHSLVKPGKSRAGFLYAMDNLGAVIVAAFFIYSIPMLGLKISSLVILAMKLVSFVLLILGWRFTSVELENNDDR